LPGEKGPSQGLALGVRARGRAGYRHRSGHEADRQCRRSPGGARQDPQGEALKTKYAEARKRSSKSRARRVANGEAPRATGLQEHKDRGREAVGVRRVQRQSQLMNRSEERRVGYVYILQL